MATVVRKKAQNFVASFLSSRRPPPVFLNPININISKHSTRLTTRRSFCKMAVRYQSDWDPIRVSNMWSEVLRLKGEGNGEKSHWLIRMAMDGVEIKSEQQLLDYYIKSLATVVGSKKAAKEKIYLVSCGHCYGFGAKIDMDTEARLMGTNNIISSCEDTNYHSRRKNSAVQSAVRFTPKNRYRRLENIFRYHCRSERNPNWNFDHWLINIKQPEGGFTHNDEITDYYIDVLAEVVGSGAVTKIYILWFKSPFGFGAEIDEKASNMLKGLPDVLSVLPDYSFDIKDKLRGALHVLPTSEGLRFNYYYLTKELDWGYDVLGYACEYSDEEESDSEEKEANETYLNARTSTSALPAKS